MTIYKFNSEIKNTEECIHKKIQYSFKDIYAFTAFWCLINIKVVLKQQMLLILRKSKMFKAPKFYIKSKLKKY